MTPISSAMVKEFDDLERQGALEASSILDVSERYAKLALERSFDEASAASTSFEGGLDRTIAKILSPSAAPALQGDAPDAVSLLEQSVMNIDATTIQPSLELMNKHKRRRKRSKASRRTKASSRLLSDTASTKAKRVPRKSGKKKRRS